MKSKFQNLKSKFKKFRLPVPRFILVSILALSILALVATAGSLTPSSSPASTFYTLSQIYNSIAGTFDSSSITASSSGSLIQSLKYLNDNLGWASSSTHIYNINSGNVGINSTSPTQKLDVVGNINVDEDSGYMVDGITILTASSSEFTLSVGEGAGAALIDGGIYNTFVGYQAGNVATASDGNTFVGYQAGKANTSGEYNLFSGYQAGFSNTTGAWAIANGYRALYLNTTGIGNIADGVQALYSNTTGDYNIANGTNTLYSNTIGTYNIAIGHETLKFGTIGSYNTALGYVAGSRASGSYNTLLGGYTGRYIRNSSYNTMVGYSSGGVTASTSEYNTLLGANTDVDAVTPPEE